MKIKAVASEAVAHLHVSGSKRGVDRCYLAWDLHLGPVCRMFWVRRGVGVVKPLGC